MRAPAGEGILFDSVRDHGATGNQSVYVMAPDGSNVRRLAHVEGVTSRKADWSPDRKRIVFSSNRTGPSHDLYVMDADGGNVRQLTDTPNAYESDPAWSPDGRHLAYDRAAITADRTLQNAQLWIIDADGSNPRALTSGSSRNIGAAWSPDGSTIAFDSDRHAEASSPAARRLLGMDEDDGDFEIYLMERDGANVRRLTEHGAGAPAWSPDGQRIAFRGEGGSLWVMNADGRNQRRLINTLGGFGPAWSPDGSQIAFGGLCYRGIPTVPPQWEKHEICVIRADGSGLRALTQNEVWDGHAAWW
jgi:TolB protein